MTTYAELVFHVLAHTQLASPASCFEPDYVAWCGQHIGPALDRELGQDVAVLEQVLRTDEATMRVQLLAQLFSDRELARRASCLGLEEIRAEIEVCAAGASGEAEALATFRLSVLEALAPISTAVEVLRLGCELERRHLERLPPPNPGAASGASPELSSELTRLICVAPALADARVRELRPLWRRGRIMPRCADWGANEIWVGSASRGQGPGLCHVAWQACHEASVLELSRVWRVQRTRAEASSVVTYPAALEHAALVLLEVRVKQTEADPRSGLGVGGRDAWAAWREHLAPGLPRGIADLQGAARNSADSSLQSLAELVEQLCDGASRSPPA